MPRFPFSRGKIKIRKVKPTREGVIESPWQATDDGWWKSVFDDPKADAPRRNYGREYLGSMIGMLFGIRCEACRLSKNFLADDLIKMYGSEAGTRTVAADLADCNRRPQHCLVRYVVLPRSAPRK